VVADMCARLRNTGDHVGALEAGRRACAIAVSLHDRDLHTEAIYRLAQAHFGVGEFVSSVDLLRQTLDAFGAGPLPENSGVPGYVPAWPRAWLALGLANLGRFADATSVGEEAVAIADSVDHPLSMIEARGALGRVHLFKGELERAIALFESRLGLSRPWNNWGDLSGLSGLGHAYALAGRVDEGLPLLEDGVERGRSIDAVGIGHAMRLTQLGEGYLLAGRLDEARERARQALQIATAQKEQGNEAHVLRLLGEIDSCGQSPEVEDASRNLLKARGLAARLGMRPLVAHCHLGLGKLYRRTDKLEQAQEHLRTATTMYREMDMTYWLEQAEKVPELG
jgi:tetratricopeptide (TPR) repeat protein